VAALGSDLPADVEFDCPRCATAVVERVYGPCAACREQLLEQYAGAQRSVVAAVYVPKMNVTPNAVALKE